MKKQPPKERLDALLVRRGAVESRSKAQALILAGKVSIEGFDNSRLKPGTLIPREALVSVKTTSPWVGRGGEKLSGALEDFGLINSLSGLWLDSGSSTGGFTQALLANGVERVFAVDVGYGLLDTRLRSDPRVVLLERTNLRNLDPSRLPTLDGATLDLSFISLRLVLPNVREMLRRNALVICLVKPQFEGKPRDVGKGGIVRNPKVRDRILADFHDWVKSQGWQYLARVPSRIRGRKGNLEEFFLLKNTS
ncbi:MAG: TlyA family RNA methyltransferase [Candidatus Hydrogenedentota bacterium]|nr:MAG: TlyA family RNA methyltransferase [Candidatus Hydrogenedentota bacterium]